MRHRSIAGVALIAAGLLAWLLLSQGAATGATAGTLTIAAPTLVAETSSTHNGGASPVCGSSVPSQTGHEFNGTLQDAAGSLLGAVSLPQGATVTKFSATAHDNTDPGDVYAFLVRKSALKQNLFTGKYTVMATVNSTGAVDQARKFATAAITNAGIDNTSFAYFVEVVNCDSTIQPIAVQVSYSTP
jgi:hypothetical protein